MKRMRNLLNPSILLLKKCFANSKNTKDISIPNMNKLTIGVLIKETQDKLQLSQINPEVGDKNKISSSALNIPGLELTGFWEDFASHKLQIFSQKEMQFVSTLSPAAMQNVFKNFK